MSLPITTIATTDDLRVVVRVAPFELDSFLLHHAAHEVRLLVALKGGVRKQDACLDLV